MKASIPDRDQSLHRRVEEYYDRFGWVYPIIWGNTIHWGFFKTGTETLVDAAENWAARTIQLLHPKDGDRLFDVGCGPATTARRLIANYDVTVDGIDISEHQLARARCSNSDIINGGQLRLIKGDIASVDLRGPYDGAISEAVFFHFGNRRKPLRKIRKALHRHGRFVFDDIVIRKFVSKTEQDRAFKRFGGLQFDEEDSYLRMLQDAGFRLVELVPVAEDMARTYIRLLDQLEAQSHGNPQQVPEDLYQGLRRSFQTIVELFWEGKLGGNLYVLAAE